MIKPTKENKDNQISWNIYKINNSYKEEFIEKYYEKEYVIEPHTFYWREYKEQDENLNN